MVVAILFEEDAEKPLIPKVSFSARENVCAE